VSRVINGFIQKAIKTMITYDKKDIPVHLQKYFEPAELGLEKTPEEYVAKMVEVFREVRRVLRDDGTLWLNLGISYAGSGQGRNGNGNGTVGKLSRKQKSNAGSCYDRTPNQSQGDVPACDIYGTESQGFQDVGHVCPDSSDEHQDEIQNHYAHNVHNDQSALQGEPPILRTARDNEQADSVQELARASLHDAPASTIEQFSCRHQGVCAPEATALVSLSGHQIEPDFVRESEHRTVCTSGTSQMLPPLVVYNVGKESFYSACGSPSCKGIGRCGLCWCSLTIPFLNVKPKDEINIPHLVAMALQSDGWFLRQTIIWAKPNPMPESVTDRCTKAHEYVFLMSKSAKYYYDAEAIKEQSVDPESINGRRKRNPRQCDLTGDKKLVQNFDRLNGEIYLTRNRRSVWTVTTKPFKEAHFATFPPDLIRPMILAGCPKGGIVLDPFGGAGTTGYVARRERRSAILIELNLEYCRMAKERCQK
jgi:DNA modification methylase